MASCSWSCAGAISCHDPACVIPKIFFSKKQTTFWFCIAVGAILSESYREAIRENTQYAIRIMLVRY
jgi:hypothetical protein